jgi:hypothetical protein
MGPSIRAPKDWAFSDFVLQPDGTDASVWLITPSRCKSADLSATALYAWSMVLAHVIAVPVLFEISVKKPQQRRSLGKSVPLFGPPHPPHLLRPRLHRQQAPLMLREPLPSPAESAPFPVLWGDWPRCSIRRRWFQLLRSQTVILPSERIHPEKKQDSIVPERQTRAQRAHWRLSWDERLARNTCPSTDTFLKVTIHGLPATFAPLFGLDVVTTAYTLWNTVCFFFLGTVLLDTSSIFTSIYTSLFHTTVGVNVSATAN